MISLDQVWPGHGQGEIRMKPKSIQSATRLILGALSLGTLAACGGAGGGGGGGIDVADGGIRGTGSSVGPVSGFGSVIVNGVRFDTDDIDRAVQSNDGIDLETELDEGMILRVDGEWRDDGSGTASRVEYDDTLRGEIVVTDAWNTGTRTAEFTVYGLVVNIDSQTVIKGKKVAELQSGDFVRVSGWRLPSGEFRASLVRVRDDAHSEVFDPENEVELEGRIREIHEELCTFGIGDITVECDFNNTVFEGIDIDDLSAGDFVEVEGDINGNVLYASQISRDDLRRYNRGDGDDVEFAGPVSAAIDPDSRIFEINGLFVRVTDHTDFEDGLTESDLIPDLLIQVEGEFLDDGTVEAEEIEIREGDSEVEGRVSVNSVSPSEQTFVIGGVLVKVSSQTAIVGDDERDIDLIELGGPEEVEVSGIERPDGNGGFLLEAFKVEVDDESADGEFELVGRLRGINANSIDVFGVNIRFDDETEFDDTTRNQLQDIVSSGERPLIEVEYIELESEVFYADKIELEEDDD